MAIDWTDIRPALRSWFMAATGLDDAHVVWDFQTGQQSMGTFAVLNPRLAIARVGCHDEERMDTVTAGQLKRFGLRRLTVSCHIFGAGALNLMELAQDYLETSACSTILDPAGLAVADFGHVDDLTTLLNTTYEERAHLDVIFSLYSTSVEQLGDIETVVMAETFQNTDGTTAIATTQTLT